MNFLLKNENKPLLYSNSPVYSIAGIGSRSAPEEDLDLARQLGYLLACCGIQVTSGSAGGMDSAFEEGVLKAEKELNKKEPLLMSLLPWDGFRAHHADGNRYFLLDGEMTALARKILFNSGVVWLDKMRQGGQKLYLRNVFQVLRMDRTIVDLIICSAPVDKRGKALGGTGVATKVGDFLNVPVLNMQVKEDRVKILSLVSDLLELKKANRSLKKLKYWEGDNITSLKPDEVFVYGSNPEFRNGAGAALSARKFGATPYGGGRGIVGQTYGLITKNLKPGFKELLKDGSFKVYETAGYRSVSERDIKNNIVEFYECCLKNPDKKFLVVYTNNNRNLNGYSSLEIFSMFVTVGKVCWMPENVYFHSSFSGVDLETI